MEGALDALAALAAVGVARPATDVVARLRAEQRAPRGWAPDQDAAADGRNLIAGRSDRGAEQSLRPHRQHCGRGPRGRAQEPSPASWVVCRGHLRLLLWLCSVVPVHRVRGVVPLRQESELPCATVSRPPLDAGTQRHRVCNRGKRVPHALNQLYPALVAGLECEFGGIALDSRSHGLAGAVAAHPDMPGAGIGLVSA